jgi:hypothetical protein
MRGELAESCKFATAFARSRPRFFPHCSYFFEHILILPLWPSACYSVCHEKSFQLFISNWQIIER